MAKKIRVELEVDVNDVLDLLKEHGKPEAKRLSRLDLEKLSKEGAIRAADYLSRPEMAVLPKGWISQFSSKASSALSNKVVQKAAVASVTATLAPAAPHKGQARLKQ